MHNRQWIYRLKENIKRQGPLSWLSLAVALAALLKSLLK